MELVKVRARNFFKLPIDILEVALKSQSVTTENGFTVVTGRVNSDGSGHFFVRNQSGRIEEICHENMEEILFVPKTYLYRHKDHFGQLEYPVVPIEN